MSYGRGEIILPLDGVVLRKLSPGAEYLGSCRYFALGNCKNQSIITLIVQTYFNGRFHAMAGNSHG